MGENKIEKRNDWSEYIGKTKNNPPKPWLIKAMSFVNAKDEALDLGPGAFNDTKFLLSEGFKHIIKRGFPDSLLRHRCNRLSD